MSKTNNYILVGTYRLGWRNVDVYGDPDRYGGEFLWFPDEEKKHSRIIVGFQNASWWETLEVLIHEAAEATLSDDQLRYRKTNQFNDGTSDSYTFHFNHCEFTQVCAKVAHFLAYAEGDVKKAWSKFRRSCRAR